MTPTPAKPLPRYNWALALQFCLLLLCIGLLFNASTSPLLSRWLKWDQDLSHALPTLAALALLVLRTQEFTYKGDSVRVRALLIICLALLSMVWLLFALGNITLFANLVLLLAIFILVAASYSIKTMVFFAPMMGLLLFTAPIFGQINASLLAMSAYAVGHLVQSVGITAHIQGQDIYLASGHIIIADGCSGLRYFTVSLLLGYLLALLNHYNNKKLLCTLAVAASLGLITNWIRIFLLVVIGNLTEMKSSLMQDHELFGWVLFALVIFPAIWLAPLYPKAPSLRLETPKLKPLLPLMALMLGPIALKLIPSTDLAINSLSLTALGLSPSQATNSLALAKLPEPWRQESVSTTSQGSTLNLYLAQYHAPTASDKIMPYFDSPFDREKWRVVQEATPADLAQLGYQLMLLRNTQNQDYQLLLYRYEVGAKDTSRYEIAKIMQIPAILSGKRYFNFFSISSHCQDQLCRHESAAAADLATSWESLTRAAR